MRFILFIAIILTALSFAPGAAHLFAAPAKMTMAREPYFIVQSIYLGWNLLGLFIIAAIAANGWAAYQLWRADLMWPFAAASAALLIANLIIFFIWTFPANQATENWTLQPENWQALRAQWEYSHAINALLSFLALCAISWTGVSVLSRTN